MVKLEEWYLAQNVGNIAIFIELGFIGFLIFAHFAFWCCRTRHTATNWFSSFLTGILRYWMFQDWKKLTYFGFVWMTALSSIIVSIGNYDYIRNTWEGMPKFEDFIINNVGWLISEQAEFYVIFHITSGPLMGSSTPKSDLQDYYFRAIFWSGSMFAIRLVGQLLLDMDFLSWRFFWMRPNIGWLILNFLCVIIIGTRFSSFFGMLKSNRLLIEHAEDQYYITQLSQISNMMVLAEDDIARGATTLSDIEPRINQFYQENILQNVYRLNQVTKLEFQDKKKQQHAKQNTWILVSIVALLFLVRIFNTILHFLLLMAPNPGHLDSQYKWNLIHALQVVDFVRVFYSFLYFMSFFRCRTEKRPSIDWGHSSRVFLPSDTSSDN